MCENFRQQLYSAIEEIIVSKELFPKVLVHSFKKIKNYLKKKILQNEQV